MGILLVFFSLQPRVCALRGNLFPFLLSSSLFLPSSFYDVPFLCSLSFPFFLCFFCPLIYICCSFHGHSMCVFLTIATHLWPAGQSGVPCSLILFSSLVYAFPFLSFPFLSFSFLQCLFCTLIYICCSFHGLSMCAFPHYSHVIVACREIWISLFSYPLLFSCFTSFYDLPFLPFLLRLFCPLMYSVLL